MQDPQALNQLVTIIIIFMIIFGVFFGLVFLYAMGWAIVLIVRLYKRFLDYMKRESDPDEIIRNVDKLLIKQRTDFILKQLAK